LSISPCSTVENRLPSVAVLNRLRKLWLRQHHGVTDDTGAKADEDRRQRRDEAGSWRTTRPTMTIQPFNWTVTVDKILAKFKH
jgi:hypothetical protein